jgi:hypothetical protein
VFADLNDRLEPHGLHFGYRVRDETLMYLANSFDAADNGGDAGDGAAARVGRGGGGLLDPNDADANLRLALDAQILQKVLPRVAGTYEALGTLLPDLRAWAESSGFARTAAKLVRMQRRARDEGIVRFYES